jgi:hypothetical protein
MTSPVRRSWSYGRWLLPPVALSLVALLVGPAAVHRPLPEDPPSHQVWIATPGTVHRILALNGDLGHLFFDRSGSYVLGGGWDGASPAMSWASELAFESDLYGGRIPDGIAAVMYDPERWAATPLFEQHDPVRAMAEFSTLAHAAGYTVILTPHPNLATVPGAVCTARRGESMLAAYLRCGIQGEAARLADVVEIQTQFLETDAGAYGNVTGRLAAQCRAANPHVVVLAGLSTRFTPSAADLLAAWDAVRGTVDGHYLAMPMGIRPWVGALFLELIALQRA